MKKALLGTTALVAGGLFAGSATAADIIPAPIPEPIEEGFTLTVSGDATAAFSFRDTDECDDAGVSIGGLNLANAAAAGGVGLGALPAANFNANTDNYRINCSSDVNALAPLNALGGSADVDGFVGHDDESTHVQFASEIRFTAEQTLANGLTITARVELEGFTAADQIDEHWISFAGHFGEIKIGGEDAALSAMFVGAPGVGGPIATLDGPSANVFVAPNTQTGYNVGPGGDSNKIVYFTPRFAGLQVGVSYAPDARLTGGSQQSDGRNHVLDSDASFIHEWSVAASYEATYGDYTFTLTGGYTAAEAETQIDTFAECQLINASGNNAGTAAAAFGSITGDFACGDRELWAIGGEIASSWGAIGANYSNQDYDFGVEETVWAVSGILQNGDWEYGLGYAEYEDEHFLGGFTDEREQWAFGIGNNLAPGVSVGAFLFVANQEQAWRKALGLGDQDAIAGGLATGLSF